jgi:hypothetical protein
VTGRVVLLAALAACGGRDGDYRVEPLECVVTPAEGVRVETRRCEVTISNGTYTPWWGGTVENTGATGIEDLLLLIVARDAAGAEIATAQADVVSFQAGLVSLPPGYGAHARQGSSSVLRTPVAKLEIRAQVRRDPPGEPPVELAPVELTWRTPPPAGAALDVRGVWCGTGAEGIGPSAGRVIFDCLLGVKNTGTVPLASIDLTVVFLDAAGAEVDRERLDGNQAFPLAPGESLMFSGARGVLAHATSRLEAAVR